MSKKWQKGGANEALRLAIRALDNGHKMKDVYKKYEIPRSTFREHYLGKRTSRKIGPSTTFISAKEKELVHYLEEMVRLACPLNTSQLKIKVVEMTQTRITPFKDGTPNKS